MHCFDLLQLYPAVGYLIFPLTASHGNLQFMELFWNNLDQKEPSVHQRFFPPKSSEKTIHVHLRKMEKLEILCIHRLFRAERNNYTFQKLGPSP